MERFIRYALEHGRKIRMVYLLAGNLQQKTVTVLAADDQTVLLLPGAKKTPISIPLTDILSCDYARGDHGED